MLNKRISNDGTFEIGSLALKTAVLPSYNHAHHLADRNIISKNEMDWNQNWTEFSVLQALSRKNRHKRHSTVRNYVSDFRLDHYLTGREDGRK